MARSRTVIVAGAGIGGLTVGLALARKGFPVAILEAAQQLEAVGAGIQLSPNAARVLIELGLGDRLAPHVVTPGAIRVLQARSGREIVRIPLQDAVLRYGAPYWVVHRGDLQCALLDEIHGASDLVVRLGISVVNHIAHADAGVTVLAKTTSGVLIEEHGRALVGADGLWSAVRQSLGLGQAPRFRLRTAWRTMVPAERVAAEWLQPLTILWLGPDAHLVHYPLRNGGAINVVAIVRDDAELRGWSAAGARGALLARFAHWHPTAAAILSAAENWQGWSLYDLPPLPCWGSGAVTLLGDAAHAMLPFLAQGGAMAIEDAAVLADELARSGDDAPRALRAYESRRQARTARAVRESARNGRIYHLKGPLAVARNLVMRSLGSERLLHHYDWLYEWRTR